MSEKISKTEEEWRKVLTPEQFAVTRKKGTERAFTGEYNACKDAGTYHCVCCGAELFLSQDKFDSGSGWPSFTDPAALQNISEETDSSYNMVRTEVLCSTCDAHLGHVFDDGPASSGKRYCINSAALKLKKDSK